MVLTLIQQDLGLRPREKRALCGKMDIRGRIGKCKGSTPTLWRYGITQGVIRVDVLITNTLHSISCRKLGVFFKLIEKYNERVWALYTRR